MIRISVPFHGSVPTNRTLSSTGPLSVQLKRSYRLHASIKAYFVGKKVLGRRIVSRSQTVTLAVTVWTTAVERFVLSSPGSRVGDKCERYRKGHESHYTPSVEYSTLYTPLLVCNEIHALCGTPSTNSHLSPTLLPGELRTKRLTAVVQTVTASVTVWLRETRRRSCSR